MLLIFISCKDSNINEKSDKEIQNNEFFIDNSVRNIKARGTLILGTSADYAPYEFHIIKEGKDEIVGFDIEIAKAIANSLDVDLKIVDMKFNNLLYALDNGHIDIALAGISIDEDRQKIADFSDVYYKAEQNIVVRIENKNKYTSLDDFEGKNISAQVGTVQVDIAQKYFENANIVLCENAYDIIQKIISGEVEAAIIERPIAEKYLEKYTNLYITDIYIESDVNDSAIAVKKGNKLLLDEINKVIQKLKASGDIYDYIFKATELEVMERE